MNLKDVIAQIDYADKHFTKYAAKSVDRYLSMRNWLIGYYIFEFEQNGDDKAQYGTKLESSIAKKLNRKGLSERNLKLFKQFYLAYPQIAHTLSALSEKDDLPMMQTLSASFADDAESTTLNLEPDILIDNLSFSHFVVLIKIDDALKRSFYEIESIKGTWSVRELKSQIHKLTFERTAAAKRPNNLKSLLQINKRPEPNHLIKTPFVFDFLDFPDEVLGSESEMEHALINDLKSFILELGHGFCFEAQQKRVIIGGEYYFIDLVFYHRILKCHVLLELKIEEFNHTHAGQLNTYIQYYKAKIQQKSDKPPIGILLCTHKNEDMVEYALGGMDKNLFVSQYQTELPSTKELEAFLKQEKKKF